MADDARMERDDFEAITIGGFAAIAV